MKLIIQSKRDAGHTLKSSKVRNTASFTNCDMAFCASGGIFSYGHVGDCATQPIAVFDSTISIMGALL